MSCPICSHKLEKTEHFNKIFKAYNYYCSNCNSYHITEEINTSDYYANEYHKKFSYNNFLSTLLNRLSLVSNRTSGRFNFLYQYGNINTNENFLEIGGTFGEFYNIAEKKIKPNSYTIVEPDKEFNREWKNLRFENNLFENIDIKSLGDIDIVQMFHVFEHIFDLDAFLERLKLIKPITFYFEVPNCENDVVKIDSLINNPHYHHFSKKSLEMLFKRLKYELKIIETIEPHSYHPYKKIGFFKRYLRRFTNNHEKFDNSGIYLRAIYNI